MHCGVAITKLQPLTSGAAIGIGLADDDGFTLQFRIRRHDLKAGIDRPKLICNPHLHVAIDKPRRSFRVEGNESERSALASGRVIRTLQTVPEKIAHELSATARRVRAANPRLWQRAPHASNRIIVQLAKLLGRATPVADI